MNRFIKRKRMLMMKSMKRLKWIKLYNTRKGKRYYSPNTPLKYRVWGVQKARNIMQPYFKRIEAEEDKDLERGISYE